MNSLVGIFEMGHLLFTPFFESHRPLGFYIIGRTLDNRTAVSGPLNVKFIGTRKKREFFFPNIYAHHWNRFLIPRKRTKKILFIQEQRKLRNR